MDGLLRFFFLLLLFFFFFGRRGVVVGLCGAVAVVVGFCVKTARHLSSSWIWIGKK